MPSLINNERIIRLSQGEFELLQLAVRGDADALRMIADHYSREFPEERMQAARGIRRKIIEPHFSMLER